MSSSGTRDPSALALQRQGEVHIWVASLDAPANGGRSLEVLSPAELERASRFLRRRDGHRWAYSRALLRMLLGGYLEADPRSLRFRAGTHGKPELEQPHRLPTLDFNMSHSHGLALYAVASSVEVGIDVEVVGQAGRDFVAIAERALGKDAAERLRELEGQPRERLFLQLWTRNEAQLKCLGVGLVGGEESHRERCWTLDLDLDEQAVGALATRRQPADVCCRRWDWRAA